MLNKIILVGRLTDAPTVKEFKVKKEKRVIVSFTLASNFSKDEVFFIDCTCSDYLNDVVSENLDKGDKIAITGRFTIRSWEDKEGNSRRTPQIYVDDIEFINLKSFAKSEEGEPNFDVVDDDTPFDDEEDEKPSKATPKSSSRKR